MNIHNIFAKSLFTHTEEQKNNVEQSNLDEEQIEKYRDITLKIIDLFEENKIEHDHAVYIMMNIVASLCSARKADQEGFENVLKDFMLLYPKYLDAFNELRK